MAALVFRINPAAPYDPLPQIQLCAIDSHLHILHGELELQETLRLTSRDHPASATARCNEVVLGNGVDVGQHRLGEVRRMVDDGLAPPESYCLLSMCVLIYKRRLELAQRLLNKFTTLCCDN